MRRSSAPPLRRLTTKVVATPVTDTTLANILTRYWGYGTFRPLQQEAIAANLDNRDSLVVLPTGGGKSLCYQLPMLVDERRGSLGLVVSPLLSLMKDQVDGLVASGIPAAALNSGQSIDERDTVLAGLDAGEYRLLYVTPERLAGEGGPAFQARLQRWNVAFVAVDEAHCISQWGHEFRPEYRQLSTVKAALPAASWHAFTATATERVRDDIVSQLDLCNSARLVGSFDRQNLVYRVVPRVGLKAQVRQVIERHSDEAGIIYCLSRREVEKIAEWLDGLGYRALPYHAGLPDDVRRSHQEQFLDERVDIMVATVAFGMGIDRSNVRFVMHAGAPRSLEHYQQESGRAGRDGLDAECVLVYSPADFAKWRQMLDSSGELSQSARTLLWDMERYAGGTRCRHRMLVEYFGQRYEGTSCNACDWCLHELEPVADATPLAQKILSAVARLHQRWGAGHVVDVLRGRETERVIARKHDQLSTFGLLSDVSGAELRGYLDQLTAQGFLAQTVDQYPVLHLTDDGLALLRAERTPVLFRQPRPVRRRAPKRTGASAGVGASFWEGVDTGLFEALRACRLEIARARGVPPYVVFHDNTLRDLARHSPSTPEGLLGIHGIGTRKAQDLGPTVLEVIRKYCAGRGLVLDATSESRT